MLLMLPIAQASLSQLVWWVQASAQARGVMAGPTTASFISGSMQCSLHRTAPLTSGTLGPLQVSIVGLIHISNGKFT
jgi:hypothetical protein